MILSVWGLRHQLLLSVCSTSPLPHVLIFMNIEILAKMFLPDTEAFDIAQDRMEHLECLRKDDTAGDRDEKVFLRPVPACVSGLCSSSL